MCHRNSETAKIAKVALSTQPLCVTWIRSAVWQTFRIADNRLSQK